MKGSGKVEPAPESRFTAGRYVFVDFRCDDCGNRYERTTRRRKCTCGCQLLKAHEVYLTNAQIAKLSRAALNFDKRYQGAKLP